MIDKLLPSKKVYGSKRDHLVDDDFIDRLNSRWTVRALIMCIFVVSGNMLWLKNILCWTPNEFANTHIEYANSICWLQGSYYLPTEENAIPDRSKPRTHFIAYYQWTPFILLGMAFLFLLPRFLWHSCTGRSGVNIKRLVIAIKEKNEEDKGIKLAQTVLQLFLDAQFESKQTLCWPCNTPKCYFGYTLSYISIKILYLINSIIQFILLHKFLSFEFTNYGWQALQKMLSGEQLFESPTFPRVTMCDFMVRRLGSNVHWYSVQCNLPFNMYNEKIFFGIWLWLIILIISNFISIISWVISLRPSVQLATINRYLKISLILEIRTGNATNTMKTETRDFKKTEVKDGTPTTTTDKQTITTREENSATTTGEGKRTVTTRKENRTVTVRENTGDVITTEENETVTTQQQDPEDNPQSGCDITSTGKGPFLNYLTMDGYLFFLLIERNTDEITAAKILKYLYKKRAHGLSMTNRLLQD